MKAALLFVSAALAVFAAAPPAVLADPPSGSAVLTAIPRCAASVEDAARGIVHGGTAALAQDGYRVHDLVIDPVLRKAWVRVADCHDSRKPLTMVPLEASLALSATPLQAVPQPVIASSASSATVLSEAAFSPPAPVLIARGDAVEISIESSSVRMILRGHSAQSAASGAPIDVVVDAAPGSIEPAHHLLGTAVAPHRVQVQR